MLFVPPLQGLYVFAVYFVMHNQLCWPTKASYTVEMSGHDGPEPPYQGAGPATIGGGGDISKSTQNLISAMEEVSTQQAAGARPLSHGGGNKAAMTLHCWTRGRRRAEGLSRGKRGYGGRHDFARRPRRDCRLSCRSRSTFGGW